MTRRGPIFAQAKPRPPTQVIVDYIESYRDRFGVEPVCTVLSEHGVQIASSTYFARRKAPVTATELEEAYLVNAVVTLHRANWGVYGVRTLWHAARRAGLEVGPDQVARLMSIAGITGAVRGRHRTVTTRRDETAGLHPDLGQEWLGSPRRHRDGVENSLARLDGSPAEERLHETRGDSHGLGTSWTSSVPVSFACQVGRIQCRYQ